MQSQPFCDSRLAIGTAYDVAAADHDAVLSGGFDLVVPEQLQNPVGRSGQIGGQARNHPPRIDRMKPVHVLARIDRLDHLLLRDVLRQRKLHDEAVDVRIGVQPGDLGKQSLFGRLLGQAKHGRAEAHLAAAFLLMSDIRLARAVVPDQNGRQMRRPVSRRPTRASTSEAICLRRLAATSFPSIICIARYLKIFKQYSDT